MSWPYRPRKDYLLEALVALALYYFGFGVLGLAVNIIFLINANREEQRGVEVYNKGCLSAMLWVHAAVLLLICVVIAAVIVAGGFGVLLNRGR